MFVCFNTVTFPTRVITDCASSIERSIANYARECFTVTPVDSAISDHNAQRYEFVIGPFGGQTKQTNKISSDDIILVIYL